MNTVYGSTVTNMEMVRNFEIMSGKFSKDKFSLSLDDDDDDDNDDDL
jgi:hypothetical protein